MVDHIVTDAAEDGATDGSHASRSHDDHGGMFFLGDIADDLSWSSAKHSLDFPSHLEETRIQISM